MRHYSIIILCIFIVCCNKSNESSSFQSIKIQPVIVSTNSNNIDDTSDNIAHDLQFKKDQIFIKSLKRKSKNISPKSIAYINHLLLLGELSRGKQLQKRNIRKYAPRHKFALWGFKTNPNNIAGCIHLRVDNILLYVAIDNSRRIDHIEIRNPHFTTPEGIKVGDSVYDVSKKSIDGLHVIAGWGYYFKLPSGWNAYANCFFHTKSKDRKEVIDFLFLSSLSYENTHYHKKFGFLTSNTYNEILQSAKQRNSSTAE